MEAQVNFKQVHMVAVVQTIWVHQVLYLTTLELCYFQFVVIYTSALLELKKEYFFYNSYYDFTHKTHDPLIK